MYMGRKMKRVQQIELFMTGRGTANINAANRPAFAQDGRTSGQRLVVGRMTDADSGDCGDAFCHVFTRGGDGKKRMLLFQDEAR